MFENKIAPILLTVCVMGAALTACDSGDSTTKTTKETGETTSGNFCGVTFSDAVQRSLSNLVGADGYSTLGSADGAREVEDALVADSEAGATSEDHELCRAYDPHAETDVATSVAYSLEDEVTKNPASVFTQYRMGSATALARGRNAVVFLNCSSSRFKDDVVVRGEITNSRASAADTEKNRKDNLAVLHAASLALARDLGCADTAGLPTTFAVSRLDA